MDLVGKMLGKYRILEERGRGGMGVVYKGYDAGLERPVAIKVLAENLVGEREFVERFLREARAAANLRHPNIVTIHEVGQEGNLYYFVMEYLPGRNLSEIIAQRGALSLAEALHITEQVAAALDYAHEAGLVHRDVKSGNIMVDDRGRAVLTDFGIVRAMSGARLTASGVTLGTPEYMSPEQARGEEAGPASDIYSLGVVLYEMLGGEVPFRATTPLAVLMKHAVEAPPALRPRNVVVPETVEQVVHWALSKEEGKRPHSGAELVAALREAMSGRPPTPAPAKGLSAATPEALPAAGFAAVAPLPWSATPAGPAPIPPPLPAAPVRPAVSAPPAPEVPLPQPAPAPLYPAAPAGPPAPSLPPMPAGPYQTAPAEPPPQVVPAQAVGPRAAGGPTPATPVTPQRGPALPVVRRQPRRQQAVVRTGQPGQRGFPAWAIILVIVGGIPVVVALIWAVLLVVRAVFWGQ